MQSLNSRLSAIHLLCWVTAPLTRMFPQSRQAGGQGTLTEKQTNKYQLDIQKCNIFQNRQAYPWDSDRETNKQIWIGSFLNPEKRIHLKLLTSAASLAKKARASPLIGTFFYILLSVKRKKSLEPPEGGLWQSTCTCFLSFDGFFLLKCPTSVCKACIEAKQKEARWYLRTRLLSFFWAPFLKLKVELLKKEFHRKTSMFFAPFIVGFHYSENQSGNGAQNFLMPLSLAR